MVLSVRLAVNDGFFGDSNVTGNLILEMVRETHDHGPLNSWVIAYHDHCTTSPFVRFDIPVCKMWLFLGCYVARIGNRTLR